MITGAAGGFGAEAARQFAENGAKLVLSDVSKDRLEGLTSSLSASGATVLAEIVDVTKEEQVKHHVDACLAEFGQLDVAINNAGMAHEMAPIRAIDVETFDQIMAVNVRSVFLGMKYQLSPMVEKASGSILNISSAAGLVGARHLSAYAASKHAVIGLTKTAADEVAKKGVRVNALCPAFADTPLFSDMAERYGERLGLNQNEAYSQISSRIPMQRVATAREIAQAMLWICDPDNSFMTGQAIPVDGGLTAI